MDQAQYQHCPGASIILKPTGHQAPHKCSRHLYSEEIRPYNNNWPVFSNNNDAWVHCPKYGTVYFSETSWCIRAVKADRKNQLQHNLWHRAMWMENLEDGGRERSIIIGVFTSWKFKLDHVTIIKNTSTHRNKSIKNNKNLNHLKNFIPYK